MEPAPEHPAGIDWDPERARLTARLSGPLRFGHLESIEHELAEACDRHRPRCFTLDCRAVGHVDSHGIAFILSLQELARRHEGHFVLSRPPAHLRQLLRMTHLDELLDVEHGTALE